MLTTSFKVIRCFLILSIAILSTKITLTNAQGTTTNIQEIEAKNLIDLLKKTEKSHFNELKKFTNSFEKLNSYNLDDRDIVKLTQSSESYKYKLEVFNDGNLVQTIATPINKIGSKTYTGALLFNNNSLNSIFCESETNALVIVGEIKLFEDQLKCPRGFKIVLQDVEEEAIENVIKLNELQKFKFFYGTNFAKNQSDLASYQSIYTDNTYYEYEIELLENGKLAQVIAKPKLGDFKSYMGGVVQLDGFFQSIVCTSEQPITDNQESITLVDGIFACPSGFRIVLSDVQQQAKNSVDITRSLQQINFLENSSFTKNKNELQSSLFSLPLENYYDYSINILENGKLAQAVTIPKFGGLKSYISGIVHLSSRNFRSIICASKQPTKDAAKSITLVDGKFACPTGFEVVLHRDVKWEGEEAVLSMLRLDYLIKTKNHTNNHTNIQNYFADLILLSNTYYNYTSEILENGKLFQAIATPKFDDLENYLGGIIVDLNGVPQLIVCFSKQPRKDIAKSIKLVDGKLDCPADFEMVFYENE